MSSELKVIWRHGRVYGLGRVLDRLSALFLIPVLVHVLAPAEWGVYLLVLVMMEVVAVAPVGLLSAVIRLYFDQDGGQYHREVIGTTLALVAGMAALLLSLAWPLALATTAFLELDPSYVPAFTVGVVAVTFNLLFEVGLNFYRVQLRSTRFMCASLARSLLQFVLSIYFVVAWDMGVLGVVLGYLLAAAAVSVTVTADVLRREGFALSATVARESIRVGLPLAPAGLARATLELIERGMVHSLAGTAVLGVYGLGSRLAEQLRVLMAGPFSDVWQVRLMEQWQRPEAKADLHRVQVFFLALLGTAALGLSLLSVEIIMVIADASFWEAAAIVPLLALGQLIRPVNYFFQCALLERKKTGVLPIINWTTVAIGAAGLYVLIPLYGMYGAAVAMLIAYVSRLAGSVFFAARLTDFARLFPWGSYAGILILAVAFYVFAMVTIGPGVSLMALALKGLLMAGFLLALYFGPIFTASERDLMRRQAGRMFRRVSAAALGR